TFVHGRGPADGGLFGLVRSASRPASAGSFESGASLGNFGDAKPVGGGVAELRIDCGPGYRIYFVRRGKALVILLCGGDKGTQAGDIRKARSLAEEEE
ncbi:MAG TPA: type II toxin-antitoxin system RelE/ParE family toxin, partial [Beijerinckiaceae bacterium]|nr:type II toxin-antitoxin system RelE/ParE family toxin [Beijerinckiaceae bacterium]